MAAEHILRLTRPDGKLALVFVAQVEVIEPAGPGEAAKTARSRVQFSSGREHYFADTFEEINKMLG
jgi:hypothetical protein